MRNLIVNAVLHSPDNSVTIRAVGSEVIVRNKLAETPVASNGAGIGLSIAERVAEAVGYRLRINQTNRSFEAVLIRACAEPPA